MIDDTYNANPASLYAALQVLATQNGEPWLVMGDMKELGADSRKMHAELGDAARSLGSSACLHWERQAPRPLMPLANGRSFQ